jgi:ribonuclease D
MIIPTGLFPEGKKNSGKVMNSNYPENISAEEIKILDLKWFEGEIILVDTFAEFKRVIKILKNSEILGFDTETKPSFRKGRKNEVSLLQLANEKVACLFRLNRIGLPDEMIDLLSDPGIVKSGVAIHDDIKFLMRIRRFTPGGFVDLQGFVKDFGIQSSGLRKLVAIILGFRISKSQQVTDWEALNLTEPQKLYAATDAWVCYKIYRKLTGSYL